MKPSSYKVSGGEVTILEVQHSSAQLSDLLQPFKKEPGMSWGNPPGTIWMFAMMEGAAVGVVAISTMPNGTLRFKSDVVLPAVRGRGVYSALCKHRLYVAGESGASKASAYAGDKSEPQYLKDGFKVQSRNRGVAYMVKSL